ncbi:MAG: VWA domain-containing protein [Caldimonas sp.]
MSALRMRTWIALALQAGALALLAAALLGSVWLDTRSLPRWLVVVDRSASVPRASADQAVADVVRSAHAGRGAEVLRLEFAGKTSALAPLDGVASAGLEPSSTDIEAALDAALAAHAEAAFDGVVVISDGQQNVGDATRALRAMRDARLPLQWLPVSRAPPRSRIAQVLAPTRARVGQRIRLSLQLAGQLDRPLRVEATARGAEGQAQPVVADSVGSARATIELDASRSGIVAVDVALRDPATGEVLDAWPDAAAVDVEPPASVLYVRGSGGALSQSLLKGGWSLDVVPATRLESRIDALDSYQAIVLDDVAIADASPRWWNTLVAAVRDRGVGLLVLGGERSFARGGYRGSTLESILPVTSEPAALDQPVSVVFAVDKSGSMGQGSGGVDRFQIAQRAVLETARGLGERDAFGVVVFDVAPRVLVPLGPVAAGVAALERDWRTSPNGGTRLAPALEAAIGELERSATARRMLVVVTDGFTDDAPIDALRARLARAHIETVALAIGPEADVATMQRLFGGDAGQVLRVAETAELPLAMRGGLERRRARIERGTIAVEQRLALPFAAGTFDDWPAVAAHAVTRSQEGAAVAVQSRRGEPLIAFQRSGRGRVVAVTCGFGSWSPQWLSWRDWPRLAGGLADWVSGASQSGAVAVTVSDSPGALVVDADVPASVGAVTMVVDTPTARAQPLATERIAPGRWRATLSDAGPGLYDVLVTTALGTQRQLHLRQGRAERGTWGTSPMLQAWKSEGLVEDWQPAGFARSHEGGRGERPPDRSLIALGLVLFLCAVLVDRARITGSVTTLLRRRRARVGGTGAV